MRRVAKAWCLVAFQAGWFAAEIYGGADQSVLCIIAFIAGMNVGFAVMVTAMVAER